MTKLIPRSRCQEMPSSEGGSVPKRDYGRYLSRKPSKILKKIFNVPCQLSSITAANKNISLKSYNYDRSISDGWSYDHLVLEVLEVEEIHEVVEIRAVTTVGSVVLVVAKEAVAVQSVDVVHLVW